MDFSQWQGRLRATAEEAFAVLLGVGVLEFQKLQVKRREFEKNSGMSMRNVADEFMTRVRKGACANRS